MHPIRIAPQPVKPKLRPNIKILPDPANSTLNWKFMANAGSLNLLSLGTVGIVLGYCVDFPEIAQTGIATYLAGYIVAGMTAVIECIYHSPKQITLAEFCLNLLRCLLYNVFALFVVNLLIYFAIFRLAWAFCFETTLAGVCLILVVGLTVLNVVLFPILWGFSFSRVLWFGRFWHQYSMSNQGSFFNFNPDTRSRCSLVFLVKFLCGMLSLLVNPFSWLVAVPTALFSTAYEQITTPEQLENWYQELREGKFNRMMLVKPAFKNDAQRKQCAARLAELQLKLTKKNLYKLIEFGLSFVLIPQKGSCHRWLQLLFPVFNRDGLVQFQSFFYFRTAFISHRWGNDGTWHGDDGVQFQEVLNFLSKHPLIRYLWIDGLCAPQEDTQITMVVIDNLPKIIKSCCFVACIDGSVSGQEYTSRVWCLYELFLATCGINPHSRRRIEALSPVDLDLTIFKKKPSPDEFVSMLLAGIATSPPDQVQIILNVLRVPKISDASSCYAFGINTNFSVILALRSFFEGSFSYFPFKTLVALHLLFLKLRSLVCSDALIPLQNDHYVSKNYQHLIIPEVAYYARKFLHRSVLGFRVYYAHEIFALKFLTKVQIYKESNYENTEAALCGKFLLEIFGLTAVASLHCFLKDKMCALSFSFDVDELDVDRWIEWEKNVKVQMKRQCWSKFKII